MAQPLSYYQERINQLLSNKTIIGHSLDIDIKQLNINFPLSRQRDISNFSHFLTTGKKTSLKSLTQKFLNINIQNGRHCSKEDARATLELYKLYKQEIDNEHKSKLKTDTTLQFS